MRGQMPLALLALVFGALETAGGAQEMIYLGIMNSETYPLIAGVLGVLAGDYCWLLESLCLSHPNAPCFLPKPRLGYRCQSSP